ncbi:ErfK/YbiS/YcfS/YnhG family protein precursor [Sphingopyxis sp. LC81]|uniref:L,D-transpeptidase n=1 Tax=Sphingopyxis sp. LC81 TaxID=1502850 RepID=UPI0005102FDC|nr:L,D-transpeptidase [Sphingopyxis sp. LC81]KGB52940.1 ErfK/YbiS/YcfS/YnhG family protein precursor [Sphingopyxis sp. LC81]
MALHLVPLGFVTLSLLLPASALAQGARASSPVELARQAERLKPGEWVWAPEISPQGPVLVTVDLSAQTATVYRNGVRIGVTTVSSGKAGHETPTGVFTILQKDPHHRSSTYNNAPMPYQERLTWDGVALHAGGLPGYPESHGCVHLPLEFSKLLFGTTRLGGTVIVSGRAGALVGGASAGVLEPEGGSRGPHVPLAPDESYRWQPELSPSGPLTITLSRSDGRAIVMRNGIEIGRARVTLPDQSFETHVLTYVAGGAGTEPHWAYVAVPGHEGDEGRPLDMSVADKARMPEAFRKAVLGAIVPGTTMLVTQAPVLPASSGGKLTVLASEAAK